MSRALTEGVKVEVTPEYLPTHSEPDEQRFVFAYTVVIENQGAATVQLLRRHWIVTDGRGRVEEVEGEGVVGEQPRLDPGQSFQYTSGCILETPLGTMHGTYLMVREDGTTFEAEISPFALATPDAESERILN